MRRVLLVLVLLGLVVVGGAGVYLAWDLDWRWRPHTLTTDQAEISTALDQSGWVSPHLTGPQLYAVVYRACGPCNAMESQLFPKLQAADVDTRVIVIARPDLNGAAQSTPAERATVAELWTNRSWRLFQQWSLAQPAAWTAPNIAPADGDAARTAVIAASRQFAATLATQLQANGVKFDYPTLIWRTKDGRLRACACADARSWRFVEKELGAGS